VIRNRLVGLALAAALALAATAGSLTLAGCGGHQPQREFVVGTRADPESMLLGNVYAGALHSYGASARVESAPDPLDKLDAGAYDVVPAFTGKVLQRLQPGAAQVSDVHVYRAMVAALPEGLAAGDYATAAQDKLAAAVTETTARAWGGRDLTALVRNCAQVNSGTVAAVAAPAELAGCKLGTPHQFPSETALFMALRAGVINAAWTTTADPGVPADVVVLADRRPPLVQAENVVPLYRRNELAERQLLAINEVAGELDTAALTDMRRQVGNGADPGQVAGAWLAEHPLGRT
jgi:glycine betaine/choline ABC-type transport system substrate-binding protein